MWLQVALIGRAESECVISSPQEQAGPTTVTVVATRWSRRKSSVAAEQDPRAKEPKMARTLLLCFIHGFKGNDNTFQDFPEDLKRAVAKELPGQNVQSVVYPKYETKGELDQCTEQFLGWLKERVMEIRKVHSEKPWPPSDRDVGVILVAHSMGGFVASDTLFRILDERRKDPAEKKGTEAIDGDETSNGAEQDDDPKRPLFPLIQGVLAFDTPYNGLARSMFVYGAFSNYNKVSSVFNVMTALAAAPAGLSKLAVKRATKAATSVSRASAVANPGWKAWQLLAVRTGTVGAIAAGGVAAYVHRKEIAAGLRSVRDLDRATIAEGYQRGVGALGQGLAYINRGNVGKSYAWLADHFTFVGALVKPRELEHRLGRLAALRGIGVCDVYASLGENGYWSGGYFVPERTFCAVPGPEAPAAGLFDRRVVEGGEDEVDTHMAMFKPDKNTGYDDMTGRAAKLVATWFNSDEPLFDDPKFAEDKVDTAEESEEKKITVTDDGVAVSDAAPEVSSEVEKKAGMDSTETADSGAGGDGDAAASIELPDESPIDIAAAASLVPLPDDREGSPDGQAVPDEKERQTYLRHLFGVAEQAGTGLKAATATWSSRLPTKLPAMEQIPLPSMPSMPSMPSVPKPSMPTFSLFSKKQGSKDQLTGQAADQTVGAADGRGDQPGKSVGQNTDPST
ncbi:hypothetical protein RB593_008354 [Gaeumannomyces tritici]